METKIKQISIVKEIELIQIYFNEDDNKHHLLIKYKGKYQEEIIIEESNKPYTFAIDKETN